MDSAWLRIAQQTLEEWHDSTKPYFPAVSRWLIVSTFYEDAFRILLQWSEQQSYLESHSHLPSIVVSFYLLTSILASIWDNHFCFDLRVWLTLHCCYIKVYASVLHVDYCPAVCPNISRYTYCCPAISNSVVRIDLWYGTECESFKISQLYD